MNSTEFATDPLVVESNYFANSHFTVLKDALKAIWYYRVSLNMSFSLLCSSGKRVSVFEAGSEVEAGWKLIPESTMKRGNLKFTNIRSEFEMVESLRGRDNRRHTQTQTHTAFIDLNMCCVVVGDADTGISILLSAS